MKNYFERQPSLEECNFMQAVFEKFIAEGNKKGTVKIEWESGWKRKMYIDNMRYYGMNVMITGIRDFDGKMVVEPKGVHYRIPKSDITKFMKKHKIKKPKFPKAKYIAW